MQLITRLPCYSTAHPSTTSIHPSIHHPNPRINPHTGDRLDVQLCLSPVTTLSIPLDRVSRSTISSVPQSTQALPNRPSLSRHSCYRRRRRKRLPSDTASTHDAGHTGDQGEGGLPETDPLWDRTVLSRCLCELDFCAEGFMRWHCCLCVVMI